MHDRHPPARLAAALIAALLLAPHTAPAQRAVRPAAPPDGPPSPSKPGEAIVAVVNGDVISTGDVDNRGKLFALSTGLPVTKEVLDRLRPQVIKQLIDERLRLQEVQRRRIVVQDAEIAEAIGEIEARNGMQPGQLRRALQGQGVALRTLVDQVRVQLGWTRVLRQELGGKAEISDAEVEEQLRLFKGQTGQPEYNVAEIFIPVDDPAKAADAQRFADTVIGQLRQGAPFPVVAAQFSQSQTALQGGDLGWVRANQLDPEVAALVRQMPPGAVSNPVRVAGGYAIVTLRGKREVGRDMATVLDIRQVFLPFEGALNPNAPTDQQRRTVERANTIARNTRGCEAMEAANKAANSPRPANPGEVRLEAVGSPPLRSLLAGLQPGQASRPIVTPEGVAVVMVCSREQKNVAEPGKEEIRNRLLSERVELASRQLQRELRRRAVLDERTS